VGERVLRNYNFLKKIGRTCSAKKRHNYLRNASCDELLAITEISSNILDGGFHITKRQQKKLLPYANLIRKIARIRSEKSARNLYNNQKGGQAFLTAILAPILVEAAHQLISKIAGNGS
jgi:hypothetical protein